MTVNIGLLVEKKEEQIYYGYNSQLAFLVLLYPLSIFIFSHSLCFQVFNVLPITKINNK